MLKKLLVPFFILFLASAYAQPALLIDSLQKQLSKATTDQQRVDLLGDLSRAYMNVDREKADEYGKKMIEAAEVSRNRELMVKALLVNGERVSYIESVKENIEKSINYYNQALELARKNKLEAQTAHSLLALAKGYQLIPDADKALGYTNQAFEIITNINNDSLKAVAYNSYGDSYLIKKEKLLALRNYLNALRIAEEKNNNRLLRLTYKNLSVFYASIEEFDKAIDYASRSMEKLRLLKEQTAKYFQAIELSYIGGLYKLKKNYDMARSYYEQSIKLADSLKHQQLKLPAYISILNLFLETKEPQKALDYFNSNVDLRNMIITYGLTQVIDQAYAYIYMDLGKYDSAKYYYSRAASFFERGVNRTNQASYYMQLAELYKRTGETNKAIEFLLKAKAIAENMGELEGLRSIARHLDSMYTRMGDYKQSYFYKGLYHLYNDSLQKLSKEKDLMQLEISDEQQRNERIAREEAQKLQRKHNLQYMGITIGIAVVFILLVLLGVLSVSETTIKVLGFFAFIFLFEFIILIADNKIHHLTHGEPLKVLGIKIVLIAMLLPLHHWIEEKVIHYLTSNRMLKVDRKSLVRRILRKKDTDSPLQNV